MQSVFIVKAGFITVLLSLAKDRIMVGNQRNQRYALHYDVEVGVVLIVKPVRSGTDIDISAWASGNYVVRAGESDISGIIKR